MSSYRFTLSLPSRDSIMLTYEQAKELATTRSKEKRRAQFINRYYYHNPRTKDKELRYVVEETTKSTRTVAAYLDGELIS